MKPKVKHKQPVLDKRIEIWGNTKKLNELNQTEYKGAKIKTVWASIIPQTGRLLNAPADTLLSNVTHKIIIRYSAMPEITPSMWFIYKGKRFDIDFILNPYEQNKYFEIFTKQVMG